MADKTIWEYPTLATAQPEDLILMASDETTFNMQVQTLKDAMGTAASSPPIIRNENWWVWDAYTEQYVDTGVAATGPAAGFGTVSATVDANVGTPSVSVATSGPRTATNIAFTFQNMKGDTGDVTPEAQAAADAAAASADAATASASAAAASAQEAAQTVASKISKYQYTATIPTTGWTHNDLYSITVSVQGILATDDCGMVELVQTGTESTDSSLRTAYHRFVRVSAGTNAITVYAYNVPNVSVPLQITVFR